MPDFRAAKTWGRPVPASELEDLASALPQGLAAVCWGTKGLSCPDSGAAAAIKLLNNLRSSEHLHPSTRRLQRAGLQADMLPKQLLAGTLQPGEEGRLAQCPGASCACWVPVLRKTPPVAAHTCSSPQHSNRSPARDTVPGCHALLPAGKPKHTQRPLLKRH